MISLRNHVTNLNLKLQGLLWEVCDRCVLLFYLASASPSITLLPYFCYKIQSSVPISVHICSIGLLVLPSKANDHFLLWLHNWLPKPNLSPRLQFQSLHSNLSPKPQFQSLHSKLISHLSLSSNSSTVAHRPSKPSYLQSENTTLPLSGKVAFLFLLH